jgi:hypothetical protein
MKTIIVLEEICSLVEDSNKIPKKTKINFYFKSKQDLDIKMLKPDNKK